MTMLLIIIRLIYNNMFEGNGHLYCLILTLNFLSSKALELQNLQFCKL